MEIVWAQREPWGGRIWAKSLKNTPSLPTPTWTPELILEQENILGADATVNPEDHRICQNLVNRWHLLAVQAGDSPPGAAESLVRLNQSIQASMQCHGNIIFQLYDVLLIQLRLQNLNCVKHESQIWRKKIPWTSSHLFGVHVLNLLLHNMTSNLLYLSVSSPALYFEAPYLKYCWNCTVSSKRVQAVHKMCLTCSCELPSCINSYSSWVLNSVRLSNWETAEAAVYL